MHDDLRRLDSEVKSALGGLDASQTQATPLNDPNKWSIQQIVEHLLLTYRATLPVIQTRIDKRRPSRAAPSLKQRVGQFLVLTLGRFPHGLLSPAAVAPSLPATLRSGEELGQRVHVELLQLDTLTAQLEGLFGTRRSASHMILGPLSASQWRRFHLVHALHHLNQIRAIRRDRAL